MIFRVFSCVYNCDDESRIQIFLRSSKYRIFYVVICISQKDRARQLGGGEGEEIEATQKGSQ